MKKLAGVLAAVLAVIAIAALYMWSQLHTEREQLAALQKRVSELEAGQKAAVAATAAVPVVAAGGNAAPGAAPAAAPDATRAAANPRSVASAAVSALVSSPEILGAQLRQQFPDAVEVLGLSPAEADKFYTMLARQAADTLGDTMTLLGGGDSAAIQEAGRKMADKQVANDREMQALLGGRFPQWEEYQGTMAARQQITQLRAMLGTGENALSEAKARPLIAALGSESARINSELKKKMVVDARSSKNVMEEQLKYTSEQNSRLIAVASSHLSSVQLDRYKQMLTQQEAMVRTMLGAGNKQGAAK